MFTRICLYRNSIKDKIFLHTQNSEPRWISLTMLAVAIISIPNLQPYQFPKINMFFLSQLTFLNCRYYILLCKHYTEYVLLHSNFGGDILKRQLWYDIKLVGGDV